MNLKGLSTGKIEKTVFDLGNGTSVEADFLFVAFGQTPNSDIVKELSPSAVNDAGFVKVKPTLQIVSEDGSLDSLFAIADITDVPVCLFPLYGFLTAITESVLSNKQEIKLAGKSSGVIPNRKNAC